MRVSGIRRPPDAPHHSSTIQSLYACTHSSPSSLSLASVNVWPQKRGKVGKQSDASTWLIVHVGEPFGHVVGAWAHLVVRDDLELDLVPVVADRACRGG